MSGEARYVAFDLLWLNGEDLRRDLADCERVATGPTPFHFWALGLSYEAARNRIVEREVACMNERGWMPTAGPLDPSQESN